MAFERPRAPALSCGRQPGARQHRREILALTQRRQTLQAAERDGKTLTGYTKARGLNVRALYDGLAGLHRKGVLPRSHSKLRNKFITVRVAAEPLPRVGGRA